MQAQRPKGIRSAQQGTVLCLLSYLSYDCHTLPKAQINDGNECCHERISIIWQSNFVKSFIRRDRQRSYPIAGITATEYQCIRLCKKHQDSVIHRCASVFQNRSNNISMGDDTLILGAAVILFNYRKCFLKQ